MIIIAAGVLETERLLIFYFPSINIGYKRKQKSDNKK